MGRCPLQGSCYILPRAASSLSRPILPGFETQSTNLHDPSKEGLRKTVVKGGKKHTSSQSRFWQVQGQCRNLSRKACSNLARGEEDEGSIVGDGLTGTFERPARRFGRLCFLRLIALSGFPGGIVIPASSAPTISPSQKWIFTFSRQDRGNSSSQTSLN